MASPRSARETIKRKCAAIFSLILQTRYQVPLSRVHTRLPASRGGAAAGKAPAHADVRSMLMTLHILLIVFTETGAVGEDGSLTTSKHEAVNKVGHGLHLVDGPV